MTFPNEHAKTEKNQYAQTLVGRYDDRSFTPFYVDLRSQIDDKKIIKNPHKGWFWHFVDNGFNRINYRQDIAPGDHMEDFPGMNHLYLRFDWADIEKEKGVYDFSPLDDIIEEWSKYGYTFSMRICCFEGDGAEWLAVPSYVFEEGAKCYRFGPTVQPDYSDEIFMKYLEKFVAVCGEKYGNDDRIEIIDIGTYGTWGEGHTACGEGAIYDLDVIKRHFELHFKYFPNKILLCNDDHIASRIALNDDSTDRLLEYAEARGIGLQDDSICCDGYSVWNGFDTMRANWAFERTYKNAPNAIEFEHYSMVHPDHDAFFRNGYTIIECLRHSHATYAGFHGLPRLWLKNEKYLTEYCANRLGYWYFLTKASVPDMTNTPHNIVKLTMANHGWAKAYHEYKLFLAVYDDKGEEIKRCYSKYDICSIDSEDEVEITIPLDLSGVKGGKYKLYAGVEYNGKPIRFAVKDEYELGGNEFISEIDVKEL